MTQMFTLPVRSAVAETPEGSWGVCEVAMVLQRAVGDVVRMECECGASASGTCEMKTA